MKISFDKTIDALYIEFVDAKSVKTIEVGDALVDFDCICGYAFILLYLPRKTKKSLSCGRTIWCNNGNMLVKVSLDNGYSYDEKMNAFVDTNAGVAFYNNIDRCSY